MVEQGFTLQPKELGRRFMEPFKDQTPGKVVGTLGRGTAGALQVLPLGGATKVVGAGGRFGARATAGAAARRAPSIGQQAAKTLGSRNVQRGIGYAAIGGGLAFAGQRIGSGIAGIGSGTGSALADVGAGAGIGAGSFAADVGGGLGTGLAGLGEGAGQGFQGAAQGASEGVMSALLPLGLLALGFILFQKAK